MKDKIRQSRIKAGLTQAQLAKKIGVSQQQIAKWENGQRVPKVSSLKKIAEACNTSITDLIDNAEQKKKPT